MKEELLSLNYHTFILSPSAFRLTLSPWPRSLY